MEMKFQRLKRRDNDWYLRIGNPSKSFDIKLRYFTNNGFRIIICLHSDWLIKLFGFNQKTIVTYTP